MKRKTIIEKQLRKKTNPEVVDTIIKAKKNEKWLEVAGLLSSPRSRRIVINLDEIEKETKEGDTVVVPGKVLGNGKIEKKIKVVALSFSDEARRKLKENKCEMKNIIDEVKSNPKAQGVKIIR